MVKQLFKSNKAESWSMVLFLRLKIYFWRVPQGSVYLVHFGIHK